MTLNSCIAQICTYYKQDLKSLQAVEFASWADHNVDNYDEFYNQVIRHFQPTLTVPFPTLSDCERIWTRRQPTYVPDYKADLPQLEELRVEGIAPKNIDAATLNFENVIDDYNHMKSEKFIYKYGYKITHAFIRVTCAWCDDNNFQNMVQSGNTMRAVDPPGGYSMLMLKQYYNIFLGGAK